MPIAVTAATMSCIVLAGLAVTAATMSCIVLVGLAVTAATMSGIVLVGLAVTAATMSGIMLFGLAVTAATMSCIVLVGLAVTAATMSGIMLFGLAVTAATMSGAMFVSVLFVVVVALAARFTFVRFELGKVGDDGSQSVGHGLTFAHDGDGDPEFPEVTFCARSKASADEYVGALQRLRQRATATALGRDLSGGADLRLSDVEEKYGKFVAETLNAFRFGLSRDGDDHGASGGQSIEHMLNTRNESLLHRSGFLAPTVSV
ncbi:MAG: hypothetical protein QM767_26095 [Anaeromyxobacter sp.]